MVRPSGDQAGLTSGSALAIATEVALLAAFLVGKRSPAAGGAEVGFHGEIGEEPGPHHLALDLLGVVVQDLGERIREREHPLGTEPDRAAPAARTVGEELSRVVGQRIFNSSRV